MAETSRLPAPVADAWGWQRRGSCGNMDSALFFHPEGERGFAREQRAAQAKKICQSCPVIVECRHHALVTEEPFGVWGGLDENERHEAIAHRRQQRMLAR